MGDREDHAKLLTALARTVARQRAVADQRGKLQEHASAKLDAANHAVQVASDHLRDHGPNPLVYRYAKTRMVESQRLRGVALRAEHDRAEERDRGAGE